MELNEDGSIKPPKVEADVNFVSDDFNYDLYDTKRFSGGLKTGARLLDDGKTYEFWKDGKRLGTSGGGGRNYYLGVTGKSDRWRATTLMQEQVDADEENLGKQRIANDQIDAKLNKCVTTGYAIIGKENRNPNNPNQTKEVNEVKMYIDGEGLQRPRNDLGRSADMSPTLRFLERATQRSMAFNTVPTSTMIRFTAVRQVRKILFINGWSACTKAV